MKQFATPYVASQLEAGPRVLIYAGDVDFICNWLGNQAWSLALEWSGASDFNAATMHDWTLEDGTVGGQARTAHGFTFLRVYDAGHMVPADKPAAALALLKSLIFNRPF